MSGAVTRFLGDSPVRVLLKLVVASLIVGMVMATFGWSPFDVFYAAQDFFIRLWNMGFSAIEQFAGYILLGAAIVIPAFLILRLLSFRRS